MQIVIRPGAREKSVVSAPRTPAELALGVLSAGRLCRTDVRNVSLSPQDAPPVDREQHQSSMCHSRPTRRRSGNLISEMIRTLLARLVEKGALAYDFDDATSGKPAHGNSSHEIASFSLLDAVQGYYCYEPVLFACRIARIVRGKVPVQGERARACIERHADTGSDTRPCGLPGVSPC